MKVYVITSGIYSEYHIVAVRTDHEIAKSFCAAWNDAHPNATCEIEEYDTEDNQVYSFDTPKLLYHMIADFETGEIVYYFEPFYTMKDYDEIKIIGCGDEMYKTKVEIIATLTEKLDRETAGKILFDRVAKFKAENLGI